MLIFDIACIIIEMYNYHIMIRKEIKRMETVIRENPDRLRGEISPSERALELKALEEAEARERNSPYKEWVQMNLDTRITRAIDAMAKENAVALRLFLFLTKHMDAYNAVQCSYTVMTEALDISRPTASRAVKYLRDQGFLYILKSGTSNIYTLNPDVVWKSWGNNVRYCEFPVNVIISPTEQEGTVKIKGKRIKTLEKKEGQTYHEQH